MKAFISVSVAAAIWLIPNAASACGCCDEHHDAHAAAQRTSAATAQLAAGEVRVKIPVAGMHCGHCVSRVESALTQLEGVRRAEASVEAGEAVVVYDKSKLAPGKLVEAIDALGFKAGKPVQD